MVAAMKIGNLTLRKGMTGKLFEIDSEDEELKMTPGMAQAARKSIKVNKRKSSRIAMTKDELTGSTIGQVLTK